MNRDSMTAGQGAAGLRDGRSREQHVQTVTREKILPRPNTERTGANRKKNKREIWHLPKRHPIKPAALSGEQGSSRDLQAPHSTQEEPIPPPTGKGESRHGQRHADRAGRGWGSCQQMRPACCHRLRALITRPCHGSLLPDMSGTL